MENNLPDENTFSIQWDESNTELREVIDKQAAEMNELVDLADEAECGKLVFQNLNDKEVANFLQELADVLIHASKDLRGEL